MARPIAIVGSVVTCVLAVVGFTVTLVLNTFVLNKYNAYGEVPIPGESGVHLPAGEVTVSFHTEVIGSPAGGGLPVPPLGIDIEPPAGVPQPVLSESYGSTTTVNNDSRVRVWLVKVPVDATYNITTDGQVNGYIDPRLAFGHESSYGWLVWVFVALFVIGLLEGAGALWWSARRRRSERQVVPAESRVFSLNLPDPEVSAVTPERSPSAYAPTGEGAKLEQLKTLTSLRDSGALTEVEFETEKRRILEGH